MKKITKIVIRIIAVALLCAMATTFASCKLEDLFKKDSADFGVDEAIAKMVKAGYEAYGSTNPDTLKAEFPPDAKCGYVSGRKQLEEGKEIYFEALLFDSQEHAEAYYEKVSADADTSSDVSISTKGKWLICSSGYGVSQDELRSECIDVFFK